MYVLYFSDFSYYSYFWHFLLFFATEDNGDSGIISAALPNEANYS